MHEVFQVIQGCSKPVSLTSLILIVRVKIIFLKISSFMFHRRIKAIQVCNMFLVIYPFNKTITVGAVAKQIGRGLTR